MSGRPARLIYERFYCSRQCSGREAWRHRLVSQYTAEDLAGFFSHGTGDI
jgi:hypothetical protein